jgi:hypothetical protein
MGPLLRDGDMPTVRDAVATVRQQGVRDFLRRTRDWLGTALIRRLEDPVGGVSVVDEDWDNLIVLDACRYDAFEAAHSLPGRLERRTSQASVTWSFLRRNFEGRQLYDTVYVAGNAVVGDTADALDVFELVGLWGEGNDPDGHPAVVRPETVVEAALERHDAHPDKRLVVHFLQPHEPFLRKDDRELSDGSPFRDYGAARAGTVTAAEMRRVYEENLELVLDYVADLVEDLDGKTVVTADHGELLGEGIPATYEVLHPRWPVRKRSHFDYGHYSHVRAPELVEVPWLVVEGDERRDVVAAEAPDRSTAVDDQVEDHLEALGYKA